MELLAYLEQSSDTLQHEDLARRRASLAQLESAQTAKVDAAAARILEVKQSMGRGGGGGGGGGLFGFCSACGGIDTQHAAIMDQANFTDVAPSLNRRVSAEEAAASARRMHNHALVQRETMDMQRREQQRRDEQVRGT